MYTLVEFSSEIVMQRGPLSHKHGGLIQQFGVSLGHDLKIRLLLLSLLLFYKKLLQPFEFYIGT